MTVDVIRWHCHPSPALRNSRDTVSGHQARVALLCNQFALAIGLPDDRRDELRFAAQHHDEAEKVMGDWPGPLLDAFPWLRPVKWLLERIILRRMGLKWKLTRKEKRILHLADKLDGEWWARRHGVTGAHDCEKLQAMADRLGLGDIVREMMGL